MESEKRRSLEDLFWKYCKKSNLTAYHLGWQQKSGTELKKLSSQFLSAPISLLQGSDRPLAFALDQTSTTGFGLFGATWPESPNDPVITQTVLADYITFRGDNDTVGGLAGSWDSWLHYAYVTGTVTVGNRNECN